MNFQQNLKIHKAKNDRSKKEKKYSRFFIDENLKSSSS